MTKDNKAAIPEARDFYFKTLKKKSCFKNSNEKLTLLFIFWTSLLWYVPLAWSCEVACSRKQVDWNSKNVQTWLSAALVKECFYVL